MHSAIGTWVATGKLAYVCLSHLDPCFHSAGLVPEHMADNQHMRVAEGELHESEAVEEKISLSDRFGLWLSFYPFRQDAYLEVVQHWVSRLGQDHGDSEELRLEALRWALARGVRSGRTAQYFARHWIGRHVLNEKGN